MCVQTWPVLLSVLGAALCLLSGRGQAAGNITLAVLDSRSVRADALDGNTSSSVPCGRPDKQCNSLHDALLTAYELRSGKSTTLAAILGEHTTADTMSRLVKHGIIKILLLAKNSTDCKVDARSLPMLPSDREIISIRDRMSLNVVIEGDQTRGCQRAVLNIPSFQQSERGRLDTVHFTWVSNCSLISFKNLHIRWSTGKMSSALFSLSHSLGVYFENVHMVQTNLKQHLCVVKETVFIQYRKCLFDGSLTRNITLSPFDIKHATIRAVSVRFHSENASKPLARLRQDDQVLATKWLTAHWPRQHASITVPGVEPGTTVVFISCSFLALGGSPPRFDQKLQYIGLGVANGIALTVNFNDSVECSVAVVDCVFDENHTPYGAPLIFRYGRSMSPRGQNSAVVSGSKFTRNRGLFSGGLTGYFQSEAAFNALSIEDCVFEDNVAQNEGGAVGIYYNGASEKQGNTITISGTQLRGNLAGVRSSLRPGGAVLVVGGRARHRSVDGRVRKESVVTLSDCSVTNNTGFGAVHVVRATVVFAGRTVFSGNELTALALSQARASVTGHFTMSHNHGASGGAIRLEQDSVIDASEADVFQITNNSAHGYGSAVYADEPSSAATLEDVVHSYNEEREISQCPIQFPDHEETRADSIKMLLRTNLPRDRSQAMVNAVFMASVHRCFQYFSPYLDEIINDKYIKFTTQCYCMPYPPAEWDRGLMNNLTMTKGDRANSKQLRRDYLTDPTYQEMCPRQNPATQTHYSSTVCWRQHGNASRQQRQRRDSICNKPNAHLFQPYRCYSLAQRIAVVNQIFHNFKTPPTLGTYPAWIMFYKASTSCYKPVGEEIWYYQRQCWSSSIVSDALNNDGQTGISTDCILHRMNFLYRRLRRATTPFLPGYRVVLVPWAGLLSSWDRFQMLVPAVCRQDLKNKFVSNDSISKITLHPAPGEKFTLHLTAADELFNPRIAPLSLKVRSDSNDVLLGLGWHVYKPDDAPAIFRSGYERQKVALYGPVGASGSLEITVEGHKSYFQTGEETLRLRIPFVLRHCHLGFRYLATRHEKAREIIESLKSNASNSRRKQWRQRNSAYGVPTTVTPGTSPASPERRRRQRGRHRKTKQYRRTFAPVFKHMRCQCDKQKGDPCVVGCTNGYKVKIKKNCWAGSHHQRTVTPTKSQAVFHALNRSTFLLGPKHGDPFGWEDPRKQVFATGFCDRIECYFGGGDDHSGAFNNMTWFVGYDNPCAPQCQCNGPLCSVCLEGYIRLPSGIGCTDCSTASVRIPVWGFYLLMVLAGGLLLAALLLLNIGVSPTLDSWFFFTQTFVSMFGYISWRIAKISRSLLTLGLGNVCQNESVSALHASASHLFIPLFLISVTLIMWTLARHGVCIRLWQFLQKRNSIMHVFWLVILGSSTSLSYLSASMLRYVQLGDRKVLFVDGTLRYFGTEHTPYAALAICVLLLVALPPPILLAWRPLHLFPSLIGFLDEAAHIYEPHLGWWPAINILRRLSFGLIQALMPNGASRRLAQALGLCVLTAAQGVFRPFRRNRRLWRLHDVDNLFEMCILLLLSVLSIIHLVQQNVSGGSDLVPGGYYAKLAVYCAVTCVALILGTYRFTSTWRDSLIRKPRNTARNVCLDNNSSDEEDEASCSTADHDPASIPMRDRSGCISCGIGTGPAPSPANSNSRGQRPINMDIARVRTGLRDPLLADQL